jgi:putative lipoic acid-binding regulatory protein
LIDYPCDFPIKVMGPNEPGFVDAMVFLARQFDPDWQEASLERRESKGGKYLGLTLTLHVLSREQLDEVYRTLSSHPLVKVVL